MHYSNKKFLFYIFTLLWNMNIFNLIYPHCMLAPSKHKIALLLEMAVHCILHLYILMFNCTAYFSVVWFGIHWSTLLVRYIILLGHIAMHSIRCSLLLHTSVCRLVCWTRTWALQKRLNRLWFHFGCGLVGPKERCIRWRSHHPSCPPSKVAILQRGVMQPGASITVATCSHLVTG